MRFLVVDDHALVRRGIGYILKERFPAADVREASGGDHAIDLMGDVRVDVAIVDVRLPDPDGLELLRRLNAGWPAVPVITLSSVENPAHVGQALGEGAAGYLLKDASPEDLAQAVHAAMSGGGSVLSRQAIRSLFHEGPEQRAEGQHEPHAPGYNLTPREQDILAQLQQGLSNNEIARNLFLSEKTVKAHLAAIFRKLGVTNRTQAAVIALHMNQRVAHGGA